jgi:hypothetical protein
MMALFRNLIVAISSAESSGCKHQAAKGQGKEEFQQKAALALRNYV